MNELLDEQTCPYCDYEEEDHQSHWEQDTEAFECNSCGKEYVVSAEYKFLGFRVQKICDGCHTTEDECFCDVEGEE